MVQDATSDPQPRPSPSFLQPVRTRSVLPGQHRAGIPSLAPVSRRLSRSALLAAAGGHCDVQAKFRQAQLVCRAGQG